LTTEDNPIDPFNFDEKGYGSQFKDHLLEQYKMFVQSAEKMSDRRLQTNTFFLSLNGFLVTLMGVVPVLNTGSSELNPSWLLIACTGGVIFCIIWINLIKSYKNINEAKFAVIKSISKRLPTKPFESEWDYLNMIDKVEKEKNKGSKPRIRYLQFTIVEIWIPVMFMILYIVIIFVLVLLLAGAITLPKISI
jgi:hypothetical protein